MPRTANCGRWAAVAVAGGVASFRHVPYSATTHSEQMSAWKRKKLNPLLSKTAPTWSVRDDFFSLSSTIASEAHHQKQCCSRNGQMDTAAGAAVPRRHTTLLARSASHITFLVLFLDHDADAEDGDATATILTANSRINVWQARQTYYRGWKKFRASF